MRTVTHLVVDVSDAGVVLGPERGDESEAGLTDGRGREGLEGPRHGAEVRTGERHVAVCVDLYASKEKRQKQRGASYVATGPTLIVQLKPKTGKK